MVGSESERAVEEVADESSDEEVAVREIPRADELERVARDESDDDDEFSMFECVEEDVGIEEMKPMDAAAIARLQEVSRAIASDEPTMTVAKLSYDARDFVAGGFRRFFALAKPRSQRVATDAISRVDLASNLGLGTEPVVVAGCASSIPAFVEALGSDRLVRVRLRDADIRVAAKDFAAWTPREDAYCSDSILGSKAGHRLEEAIADLQRSSGLRPLDTALHMFWARSGYLGDASTDHQYASTFAVVAGDLAAHLASPPPRATLACDLSPGDCLFLPPGWTVKFRRRAPSSSSSHNLVWVLKRWLA